MAAPRGLFANFCRLLLGCLYFALIGCGGGGSSSRAPAANPPATTNNPPATTNTPPATTPDSNQVTTNTNAPPTTTQIKLLALVSPGVDELYADPQLRLDHLVNFSNRILQESGVALEFVIAASQPVSYADSIDIDSALNAVTDGVDPAFTGVAAQRDAAGADLVVLFRPYANDGRCGLAWIGGYQTDGDMAGFDAYGYSVVAANCSDFTLMHELGHNLGLVHSRDQNPEGGTLAYSAGHGVAGLFATVMATPDDYNAPRLPRVSNPLLECEGAPCGVPATDSNNGADSASALDLVKDQVAGYRP